MKPSDIKHLTDLEMLKVDINSKEIAIAYLNEAGKRNYLSTLPPWYRYI